MISGEKMGKMREEKLSRKTGKAMGRPWEPLSFQANSLPAPGPAVVKRLDHEVEEIRRATILLGASIHVAPSHVLPEKGGLHVYIPCSNDLI